MGTGSPELIGQKAFKILSLDGGGIRGTFSAAVLASLETRLGARLVDHFDLIVGTSTGAIIALGLAARLSASRIRDFYCLHGPHIFEPHRGLRRAVRLLASLIQPKHTQGSLRAALQEVFGERTLADLCTRTVVPAFSASAGRIRLFKTPHHAHITGDGARSLVEVALASCAAPYFLPGYTSAAGERFIDGGIWANDPIAVGAIEAVGYLGMDARTVRILSIGTTREPFHVKSIAGRGLLGLLSAQPLNLVMTAQTTGARAMATVLLGDGAITRIDEMVMPGRFALDRSGDIGELCGLGEEAATHAAPRVRELFLDKPAMHPHRTQVYFGS